MFAAIQEIAAAPKQDYSALLRLETELLKLPQVELQVVNDHCNNLLARSMFIPAGVILIGAVHRKDCFFLVRSGELAVTTDGEPVVLHAGCMLVTKAGTKRAGVAITDVIVTSFHSNPENETDAGRIWDAFTLSPRPVALGARADELLECSL